MISAITVGESSEDAFRDAQKADRASSSSLVSSKGYARTLNRRKANILQQVERDIKRVATADLEADLHCRRLFYASDPTSSLPFMIHSKSHHCHLGCGME